MDAQDISFNAAVTAVVGALSAIVGAYIKSHYDLRNKHVETDQALKMTDRQVILEELKTLRDEVRKEREMRVAAQLESNELRFKVESLMSRLSEIESEYETIKASLEKCLEKND